MTALVSMSFLFYCKLLCYYLMNHLAYDWILRNNPPCCTPSILPSMLEANSWWRVPSSFCTSDLRFARQETRSVLLFTDLLTHTKRRVLAVIQVSALLSGRSKFIIVAVLAKGKNVCTVVKSQEPNSLLNKHEKRKCSKLALTSPWQPSRQEDDIFPQSRTNSFLSWKQLVH